MGEVYNDLPCTIEDVVGLIGIQVIRNTNTQMHCRCPFCNDRKAHLNVRKDKDVFRCNRCGKGGGVLHLYAFVHEVTLNTAYPKALAASAPQNKYLLFSSMTRILPNSGFL